MSQAQVVIDKTLIKRMQELDRYLLGQGVREATAAEFEESQRLVTLANAAPELLAACQMGLKFLASDMQHKDNRTVYRCLLKKAIATAEGQK